MATPSSNFAWEEDLRHLAPQRFARIGDAHGRPALSSRPAAARRSRSRRPAWVRKRLLQQFALLDRHATAGSSPAPACRHRTGRGTRRGSQPARGSCRRAGNRRGCPSSGPARKKNTWMQVCPPSWCKAEDIGLLDRFGIDALLRGDEAHGLDAVAIARRLLEIERARQPPPSAAPVRAFTALLLPARNSSASAHQLRIGLGLD